MQRFFFRFAIRPKIRAALLCACGLWASSAFADETRHCLDKQERRAVIASRQVVPLKSAISAARVPAAEVLRARLCRGPKGYVYLLTVLARDGKVSRVAIDARSGVVLSGR
ncbi:MAG: PepSY domain-containing protein [Pseudorhodoplanes sp.]